MFMQRHFTYPYHHCVRTSSQCQLISEPAGEGEESSITSKLVSQLKTTVPDPEQNDVDDDDDFFDALPVIVTPDSPQVSSSPESSLGKDSVGSRLDSTSYSTL